MTDFYSQNRCVCSTRSHGPLLCAFCLSLHFNIIQRSKYKLRFNLLSTYQSIRGVTISYKIWSRFYEYNTIQYNTIQYNTKVFISNKRHTSTFYKTESYPMFRVHDWKGSGQKKPIIIIIILFGHLVHEKGNYVMEK